MSQPSTPPVPQTTAAITTELSAVNTKIGTLEAKWAGGDSSQIGTLQQLLCGRYWLQWVLGQLTGNPPGMP